MNSVALLEENQRDFYSDRNYSPAQGRFLSEDPIGFAGRDFNLYRYVANNPINKNDPSGKVAPVVIGGVVGGIVGGVTSGYLAAQNRCASKGDIALATLAGVGIGAITGVLATLGGLGKTVALDVTEGILATSTEGSVAASLFGDVLGTASTIYTGLSIGSSDDCGCGGN